MKLFNGKINFKEDEKRNLILLVDDKEVLLGIRKEDGTYDLDLLEGAGSYEIMQSLINLADVFYDIESIQEKAPGAVDADLLYRMVIESLNAITDAGTLIVNAESQDTILVGVRSPKEVENADDANCFIMIETHNDEGKAPSPLEAAEIFFSSLIEDRPQTLFEIINNREHLIVLARIEDEYAIFSSTFKELEEARDTYQPKERVLH